jgi:hypothetical protein
MDTIPNSKAAGAAAAATTAAAGHDFGFTLERWMHAQACGKRLTAA